MDAVAPETALAPRWRRDHITVRHGDGHVGAIIPGATVVVKSIATATQFDTVTNESGYFSVPALDPGAYTVTVTLMGFKTAVLNDVRINASTPATVKVALRCRRPGRNRRRHRRLRDDPDHVGGGDVDD